MPRQLPRPLSIELYLENPFDAAELSVRNEANEINWLLIQTNETISKAIFKIELRQVSYCYLPDGTPAALIVFQSEFLFTSRNLIKQAAIRLALADTRDPDDLEKAPLIVKIAPLWHQGGPATKKIFSTTSIGASLGPPLSSVGTNHHRNTTTKQHQTGHVQIRGIIASHHPRKYARILNRAVWNVEENDVRRAGIPLFFRGAVLVRYERAFQIEVEVNVVQRFAGSVLQFFRKSERGRNDPVSFAPGEPYPPGSMNDRDLEGVDLELLVKPSEPRGIPRS